MCQTTDKTTLNTCPLKTYWQEKQCWEYQCDKVSGDTTCDNPFDAPCDYQIQLQNHNKQMANPEKSESPLVKAFLTAKQKEKNKLRKLQMAVPEKVAEKMAEIKATISGNIARYEEKLVHLLGNEVVATDYDSDAQKLQAEAWREDVKRVKHWVAKWKQIQAGIKWNN